MRVLSGSLIIKLLILLLLISLLIFGYKPFKDSLDPEVTLIGELESYKSETRRLADGSYLVAVRTSMPSVKAEMVRWWFAEFLTTTEHYKWWHPSDHVWMDWENKIPGEIIGASHLVHEYIGGELSKLRIQFVNPAEFFGYNPNDENTFVICARAGMLDIEINIAKMCHIVKNNENGSEKLEKQLKISLCRCLILTCANKSTIESKCNSESYFLTLMLQVKSNSATISFAESLPILFKVNDLGSLECMA